MGHIDMNTAFPLAFQGPYLKCSTYAIPIFTAFIEYDSANHIGTKCFCEHAIKAGLSRDIVLL